MLLGFDLNHLFLFPVEDARARKQFIIGALLILAGFIIPILPYLLIMGYTMRIMRQVFDGQKPFMPEWDDWETLLKDGLKLFGIRLVYSLPVFIIMIPFAAFVFFGVLFLPGGSDFEAAFSISMFIFSLMMMCLLPFFIAIGVVIPAVEAHVVASGEFSAGFRFREWWNIFIKNIGGFIVAYMVLYGISMILSLAFQFMIFTIVLLCLMPIILPVFSIYMQVIYYALIAQAYRDGLLKLSTEITQE